MNIVWVHFSPVMKEDSRSSCGSVFNLLRHSIQSSTVAGPVYTATHSDEGSSSTASTPSVAPSFLGIRFLAAVYPLFKSLSQIYKTHQTSSPSLHVLHHLPDSQNALLCLYSLVVNGYLPSSFIISALSSISSPWLCHWTCAWTISSISRRFSLPWALLLSNRIATFSHSDFPKKAGTSSSKLSL